MVGGMPGPWLGRRYSRAPIWSEGCQGPGSEGGIPGPQYGRRDARALAREEGFQGPNMVGGVGNIDVKSPTRGTESICQPRDDRPSLLREDHQVC